MYPYNFKMGQRIQTHADGVAVDRAFIAHIHIPEPAAAAADSIATIILGAEAQALTEGFENPDYPRALVVKANVSSVTGTVKITGKNFAGDAINESFTLNGQTAQNGSLAFKEITKIELPVQVHTPAQQTETIEITGAPSQDGKITVAVTAAALGGDSPASVEVDLVATTHNDATKTADAIVAALNDDDLIGEHFTASNEAGVITLEAKEPAANDSNLAIAITAGDTGVTSGASTDGTTGVPYDIIVSVGWNDVLGLPFKLAHNTVLATYLGNTLEATAAKVTTDVDEIEKNTIDLNSALDGHAVDIYLMV